jgi:hypothetical protein
VDATCCLIMGLMPERLKHLSAAGTLLGHLKTDKIQQLGEQIANVRTPFAVLEAFRRIAE